MSKQTRSVIVTGSSSGIGLEVARLFLNEGANVVVHGRDSKKLAKAATELGVPDRVAAVAGDIGRRVAGPVLRCLVLR